MNANDRLKWRASIESALALLTAGLFVVTLITREWIEALTGWDPDHGSGSLEWAIVAALLVAAVSLSARARSDWRKLQVRPA